MISYRDVGQGEAVLFLHGWAASGKFWRFSVDYFAKNYRCIVPDLPGFGDTKAGMKDPDLSSMTESVHELLKHLGVSSFHVVGHCMGGSVAVKLCDKNREAVRSLTLANSPLSGKNALYDYERYLLSWPIRIIIYFFSRVSAMRRLVSSDFDMIYRLDRGMARDMIKADYRVLVSTVKSFSRADQTDAMTRASYPVMVIYSDKDNVIRSSEVKRFRQVLRSCVYYEMKGVGHCSMIERPEEFNIELGKFLKYNVGS